jgi:hypothetical protein
MREESPSLDPSLDGVSGWREHVVGGRENENSVAPNGSQRQQTRGDSSGKAGG